MSAENNYTYNNRWRLSKRIRSTPEKVMEIFQANPSRVFPFPIQYPEGTPRRIEMDKHYNLRVAPLRTEPVVVDSVKDISFRFSSLPGHWHGANATIEFTVFRDDNDRLYLQQHAEFPRKWYTPAADIGSKIVWFTQARRLSHRIKSIERQEKN